MPFDLVRRIAVVGNKALSKLLDEAGESLDRSSVHILKAELDAKANKKYSPTFQRASTKSRI